MWQRLRWHSAGISICFSDELTAPIFMDFNEFKRNLVSGIFDRRRSPNMDGVITYKATLSEGQIKIPARVMAFNIGSKSKPIETVIDEYTALLCDAFNPLNEGKLIYETNTGTYFIDCRPLSVPVFGEVLGGTLPFAVDLYSDYPYWKRNIKHEVNIGTSIPLLGTPLEAPFEGGEITSISQTITNNTRHNIFPIIRFWPSNSTPSLINSATGKRIALNCSMSDGFYIDIDAAPHKSTVTLCRYNESLNEYEPVENVSYWLTKDSSIDFEIRPGENILTAENIVASNYPAATVIWREQSLGV